MNNIEIRNTIADLESQLTKLKALQGKVDIQLFDNVKFDFEHTSMTLRTNDIMLENKNSVWTVCETNKLHFPSDIIFAYPSQIENPKQTDIWCFDEGAIIEIIKEEF